jgi:UDP-galactopyranose mutase
MKKEFIDQLLKNNELRIRQKDKERIKSMIKSAEINVSVVKKITLDDDSATVIFREIYESIRQLGDAKWWSMGYEPLNHDVSIRILEELEIKEKIKLNYLRRFKKIRNDANYRGFMISASQAKEMIDFWNICGKDIIRILSRGCS